MAYMFTFNQSIFQYIFVLCFAPFEYSLDEILKFQNNFKPNNL